MMSRNKYFLSMVCALFISSLFAVAWPLALQGAQSPSVLNELDNQLKQAGENSGPYAAETSGTTMSEFLGTIVKAFLGLLGVIFIVLILFAGFTWMTAHGEEEKINKAKEMLKTAIIGLIIVVGAYAIWFFIYMWVLF